MDRTRSRAERRPSVVPADRPGPRADDPTGAPLDPGVRRLLEPGLGADLSSVRVHTGPKADRLLLRWGGAAATRGCDVWMSTTLHEGTDEWLRVLAHETSHVVQQAAGVGAGLVGVGRAGSAWEHAADTTAERVLAGVTAPSGIAVAQPHRDRPSGLVQRFNAWEHRLLGDVPSDELVMVATKASGWQQVVQRQIDYLTLWVAGTAGVTAERIHAVLPDLQVITLRNGCLATYGELNAVGGDYAANPTALNDLPSAIMTGFLQQVRQESLNRLRALLGQTDPINLAQAIIGYQGESEIGLLRETQAIEAFTSSLGVNHYYGLLARNACHFAPFGWTRWRVHQAAAAELAQAAFTAADPAAKSRLTQEAWVTQAYADHFIEDAFAAGHLVNKTLIMQWFTDWAAGQPLLPVPGWDLVKQVDAARQPGLMGAALYARGYSGPSNDPQSAEEQATYAARMAATGVVASGGQTQGEGYAEYLAFLEASVVQLSSNQVHNHFNETSLTVTSPAHPSPFVVYGDENLLRDGAGIEIPAAAVASSKRIIADLLATGSSSTTPQDVLDQLPSAVQAGPGTVGLLQWHDQALRHSCETTMFGGFKSYLTILGSSMGLVSQDQNSTGLSTKWSTSLPGCGYNDVSITYDGAHLLAGSNGHVYAVSPVNGAVGGRNDLPGLGFNEVRLASDGVRGYLGTNGYALGLDLGSARTLWQTSLPGCGYHAVSMLTSQSGAVYAGSWGNVYRLDPAGGSVQHRNDLPGRGYADIRLDVSGSVLCVGSNGYALGLDAATLSTLWQTSLPGCGYTDVTVLATGAWLVAGSNGYLYVLDPTNGQVRWSNSLSGRGYHGIGLASDGTTVYVGTSGHVLAFTIQGLTQLWDVSLSASMGAAVSLQLEGEDLFVGVNGYLYQLDAATGRTMYTNSLSGYGLNTISTGTDGQTLFVGIDGYVVGVGLDPA